MSGQRFENGEDVMGRWPGSSLYYEVRIASFDPQTQLYSVRYKDGTELELKDGDIRTLHSFRNKKGPVSPSRRRSRSRSRSPGRRRSKSPSRTPKSENQSTSILKELQKEVLKVHLTPLRLTEYNGKWHGEAEVNETNFTRQRVTRAKAEEENEKTERVLRYSLLPKKEETTVPKERNRDIVVEEKPIEKAVEQPRVVPAVTSQERPVMCSCPPLEFGGSLGALLSVVFMPPAVVFLLNTCLQTDAADFLSPVPYAALWDPHVLGFFVLWLILHALFFALPVGKVVVGPAPASGKKLQYRLNGFCALLLTAVTGGVMLYLQIDLLYVYRNFLQFAASGTLLSVLLSVYLYVRSFRARREDLSPAGNAGTFVYRFFMGRELNPHIRGFDLKYFFALRPGLIGWVFFNGIMLLAEMHVQKRELPSVSMVLVNSFQLLYVAHGLWNEEGAVACMDIVHDGFGFMLAFGNLVWLPFLYSLQAFYLVNHPVEVSWPGAAAIVALNTLGYIIFRGSNNQKLNFRKNPNDPRLAHLKTIPTSTGKKLLVSGWWGFVRHPHYLGDLLMAWAWCLPCVTGNTLRMSEMISRTISSLFCSALPHGKIH
uniref:Lamin B receptor n=1 Tax=Leptobrachium leishanense TaxID=445787 RepID=A0A8C5WCH4_9ANUR